MDKSHEIAKIAYALYQKDCCMPGRELEHWLEAEKIVQTQQSSTAPTKPISVKKATSASVLKKKVLAKSDKPASKSQEPSKRPTNGKLRKASN